MKKVDKTRNFTSYKAKILLNLAELKDTHKSKDHKNKNKHKKNDFFFLINIKMKIIKA